MNASRSRVTGSNVSLVYCLEGEGIADGRRFAMGSGTLSPSTMQPVASLARDARDCFNSRGLVYFESLFDWLMPEHSPEHPGRQCLARAVQSCNIRRAGTVGSSRMQSRRNFALAFACECQSRRRGCLDSAINLSSESSKTREGLTRERYGSRCLRDFLASPTLRIVARSVRSHRCP